MAFTNTNIRPLQFRHCAKYCIPVTDALNKKEQCYLDLENDPYAIEMNDIPLFEGASVVNNDRPAWTTLLLQFYFIGIVTSEVEEEGDSFPTPYGLCIPDAHGLMRCNAALVPYFLDLMVVPKNANYTTPFIQYFSELPMSCMMQGGMLVHTSFTTDCFPIEGIADEVEFFGIPQCVPESCNERRANRFWKEHIKSDLEELKSGSDGFPGGDKCKVKFRMETKGRPKKGKAMLRLRKKNKKKKTLRGRD